MKIALICTEKLPVPPVAGGAIQLYIDGIVPYLSGQHDVTVYCVQYPGLPDSEISDNVNYIRAPGKTETAYTASLKNVLAPGYDLIHVFNRPRLLLALSESLPESKFSLSLHNEMFHPDKISDGAALKCVEKAEFINTVSRYIAKTVVQRIPAAGPKVRTVYSGVDPAKYKPAWTQEGALNKQSMKLKYGLQDYRIVLSVSRLSVKKGVHVLLEAMETVMKKYDDVALVITGSKWYGKNDTDDYVISLRSRSHSLSGPVIFTGFVPPSKIPGYYNMGDLFVCASQWNEPLARVHYEAMAAGLPFITTNRGGNAEIAEGYGNGVVIDEYNDPSVIARQICDLLNNPQQALTMGKAGRKLTEERFNWQRVASEIFKQFKPVALRQVTEKAPDPTVENVCVQSAKKAQLPSVEEFTISFDDEAQTPSVEKAELPSVSIIGAGYVGLVTGACLASMGINVCCCDNDAIKIENLKRGILPIYEPCLESLVHNCVNRQKRLRFTSDMKEAVNWSDIIFICVNTPAMGDGTCDTGHVFEAAREIAPHMNSRKVIVNKSTVPVGTCRKIKNEIIKILSERNKNIEFDVASNPEFLKEGSAVEDFINPDRIVIGAENERAVNIIKEVYREQINYNIPVFVTGIEAAEMIKYASNAFLATKISFINEMANICELCNIDISLVVKGMSLDKRIGRQYLDPGPGFGGSCFPKDVRALVGLGKGHGYEPQLLSSVLDVNNLQKKRIVKKIEYVLGGFEGRRITVLGLAFKPETDDIRESPSLTILPALLEMKAVVSVYDPHAMENMKKEYAHMDLKYCNDVYSACSRSECIVLVTAWKEFTGLDFVKLKSIMKNPVFFDLRNIYEPEYVKSFGFYYEGVGRK